MDYLPIFIDLKHRQCLVVGGGDIAARKAALLLKAQASVSIVAPEISEMCRQLLDDDRYVGKIEWINAKFSPTYLGEQILVITATDDENVNLQVYQAAKDRNSR